MRERTFQTVLASWVQDCETVRAMILVRDSQFAASLNMLSLAFTRPHNSDKQSLSHGPATPKPSKNHLQSGFSQGTRLHSDTRESVFWMPYNLRLLTLSGVNADFEVDGESSWYHVSRKCSIDPRYSVRYDDSISTELVDEADRSPCRWSVGFD